MLAQYSRQLLWLHVLLFYFLFLSSYKYIDNSLGELNKHSDTHSHSHSDSYPSFSFWRTHQTCLHVVKASRMRESWPSSGERATPTPREIGRYTSLTTHITLLRKLRSLGVRFGVMERVYKSVIQSLFSFIITIWFGTIGLINKYKLDSDKECHLNSRKPSGVAKLNVWRVHEK